MPHLQGEIVQCTLIIIPSWTLQSHLCDMLFKRSFPVTISRRTTQELICTSLYQLNPLLFARWWRSASVIHTNAFYIEMAFPITDVSIMIWKILNTKVTTKISVSATTYKYLPRFEVLHSGCPLWLWLPFSSFEGNWKHLRKLTKARILPKLVLHVQVLRHDHMVFAILWLRHSIVLVVV